MPPSESGFALHPRASEELDRIYAHTFQVWGEAQADRYVSGLLSALDTAFDQRSTWRVFTTKAGTPIPFIRYEHHYMFFTTDDARIHVLAILHERMDFDGRLARILA